MNTLVFSPLDTLFFRDGRPYNQGEQQADVESLFPPQAPTLIGAARAALARGQGWRDSQVHWSDSIVQVLGSQEKLGQLSFTGLYLARRRTPAQTDKLYLPAPAHLLLPKDAMDNTRPRTALLQPGTPLRCDLADQVRLPALADNGNTGEGAWKYAAGQWLTRSGMASVLKCEAPNADQILESKNLWQREPRTGNQRNTETRTVTTGKQGEHEGLYSSVHIRLERDIILALGVEGLPPQWQPQSPTPLGGEGRMAAVERMSDAITLPECPDLKPVDGRLRYQVVLITPMDISENEHDWPTPDKAEAYAGLPGKIVSACTGRPAWIGGWDGLGRSPLALKPHLSAGSVMFMETDPADLERVKNLHGSKIGARTEWGFGQLLIGTWNLKE